MSVIYKTLFEIRFLHEYYLINSKGESYFNLPDDQQRAELLSGRVINNQYRLNEDWQVTVADPNALIFEGQQLRLLETATGFRVMIKVNKATLANGTLTYTPFTNIAEGTELIFCIKPVDPAARRLANFSLAPSVKSIYYFSNDNSSNNKTFPFLTLPVPSFDPAKIYDQGDIAFFPGEGNKEFINRKNTLPANQWRVLGGSGLVSTADRILLPHVFRYTFPASANVTEADFILKAQDGSTVIEQHTSQTNGLTGVSVNCTKTSGNVEVPDGLYLLEVTGNNNFDDQQQCLLSSSLYNENYIGIINVKIARAGGNFALLLNDGSIITRIMPDATKISHPVYELRFRSRITYWRYISKDARPLKPAPEIIQFHVDNVNGKLVAKEPRPFSYTSFPFIRSGGNIIDYLPQPVSDDAAIGEESRLYADIIVPATGIFSKGP